MPPEDPYGLSDLVALTGVTTRTIRYYIAIGLLPSPGQTGPGARYSEGHLARLRLIKQLQRQHFPLADIRGVLADLTDAQVAEFLDGPTDQLPPASAKDYLRGVLGDLTQLQWRALSGPTQASPSPSPQPPPGRPFDNVRWNRSLDLRGATLSEWPATGPSTPEPSGPHRSQWERVVLGPDIELQVRRPLSRHQHRRVEKLIAIARQVLEEE